MDDGGGGEGILAYGDTLSRNSGFAMTVFCVTVTEKFCSRRGPKTEMLISGRKEEQFYSSTPRGAFYLPTMVFC